MVFVKVFATKVRLPKTGMTLSVVVLVGYLPIVYIYCKTNSHLYFIEYYLFCEETTKQKFLVSYCVVARVAKTFPIAA